MNAKSMQCAVLVAVLSIAFPMASFAGFEVGIGINVGFAPPPLPVYEQPPCPAPGYIWTPGYWAYADDEQDYYWVPGTWVMAPNPGLLWTPGYWGEMGDGYVWNEGYWGAQVGFYGGINYGFGYFGDGFAGGYWRGRDFFYNRSVANVSNVNITNVYNHTVINNYYDNRASFNGPSGIAAAPTHRDLLAARQPHFRPTAPQRTQAATARTFPTSLASINHGRPPIAATRRPGSFQGSGVVTANGAQGASMLTNASRGQNSPSTAHSFPSGQRVLQSARSAQGQNGIQTARTYQPAHSYQAQRSNQPSPNNFPMQGANPAYRAPHAYQAPQAPHNYQAYQAPHAYQAPQVPQVPHNYPGYQAPHAYQAPQAPHNYPAYQAPRASQAPRNSPAYQPPHGDQAQHK